MVYAEKRNYTGRLLGFAVVILLHVGLIWALANGLGEAVIEVVQGPIEARIIQTPAKPKPAPPPPPAPVAAKPKPDKIRPREVTAARPIQTAPTNAPVQPQSAPVASTITPAHPDPAHPNDDPPYPSTLREMEIEGRVTLLLNVGIDGRVHEARMKKSSGYPEFDEAAMRQALRSWRFIPAEDAGKPVASWLQWVVGFHIQD